jgi:hypothetical protein
VLLDLGVGRHQPVQFFVALALGAALRVREVLVLVGAELLRGGAKRTKEVIIHAPAEPVFVVDHLVTTEHGDVLAARRRNINVRGLLALLKIRLIIFRAVQSCVVLLATLLEADWGLHQEGLGEGAGPRWEVVQIRVVPLVVIRESLHNPVTVGALGSLAGRTIIKRQLASRILATGENVPVHIQKLGIVVKIVHLLVKYIAGVILGF